MDAAEIVKNWYWQAAEGHNRRWTHATDTITRFYESAPLEADVLKAVIEYLRTQEALTSFSIHNKLFVYQDGAWNAVDAWFSTVQGDRFANTESAKVRIYQTLRRKRDAGSEGDGWHTLEDGCRWKVSHTFYWDVDTLPELPQSTSGVQYRLEGVTRDRETGAFSCVLEKRERVKQTVAEYRSTVTAFQKTERKQFLGVKADEVAATGDTPAETGPADGKITTRHVTKNDDCTSDIENTNTTEISQAGAVKTWRRTPEGTVQTIQDRNQTTALDETNIAIGEERRTELTEGMLHNNTTTTTTPANNEIITRTHRLSSRIHTDATTTADTAASQINEQETAEVNKVKEITSQRNGAGGWNNTTQTSIYSPADKSIVVENNDVKVTRTVAVNQTSESVTDETTTDVNKSANISISLNDHGSIDVVKTEETHKSRSATVYAGTADVKETITATTNATSAGPAANATIAANKAKSISISLNDHGSMSVMEHERSYEAVTQVAKSGSKYRTDTTTWNVNAQRVAGSDQTAGTTDKSTTEANKETSVSLSINDHGSMNVVSTERTWTEQEITNIQTNFADGATSTTIKTNATSLPTTSASNYSISASPNDHGSMTTSLTTHTPTPLDSNWITWTSTQEMPRMTYVWNHGVRVFKNQTTVPSANSSHNISISVSINRYGFYDGVMSYNDLASWRATDSGSGGSSGGTATGTITFDGIQYNTVAFYGTGNEGAEANRKANAIIIKGLTLPSRTYITGVTIDTTSEA